MNLMVEQERAGREGERAKKRDQEHGHKRARVLRTMVGN